MNNFSNEMLLSGIETKCAKANYSSGQNLQVSFYLGYHLVGLIPHFLVMPATAKLAKKRTAFAILLNNNIMHIFMMFWYMEMLVGYFLGYPIVVPFGLDVILYQICAMAVAVAYNLLALNRIVAIMAPILYCHIFTIRFTRIYLGFCWLCGFIYSLILNFKPNLRAFPCLSSLMIIYPPGLIEENGLYFRLIKAVSLVNLVTTSYTPTVFYAICLFWMIGKKVWKVIGHKNAIVSSSSSFGHHANPQNHQPSPQPLTFSTPFDNYSRERMQLYGICIVGTMPPFMLTLFSMVYFSAYVTGTPFDPVFVNMFTILFATFHIQQPMVMLLLSRELRAEMRVQIDKIWKRIRPLNPDNNDSNRNMAVIHVNNTKIVLAQQPMAPQKQ